ncbi:MAG: S53 family peptidase [Actinomycetota bacterium]|nr:S53 family peptidase [Actinomycetota bacterium]
MRVPGRLVVAFGACGLTAAALAAAGPGIALSTSVAAGSAATGSVSQALAAAAGVTVQPGVMHVGHAQSSPPTTADCEKAYKVACYEPAQIQQAYHLPELYASGVTGRGATIVIVDSYGSPTIKADLGVFDQAFGLPAPPSLRVIQPAGKVPPYDPNNSDMVGWAGETTLDVEYAHTIAPGASILLVETPVSETEGVHGFPQIITAEEYVIRHHLGDVISQSFSATEQTFPSPASVQALRGAYQLAARDKVTVLAAAGDSGAADVRLDGSTYYLFPVTSWPDSDPLVTGIGGTQLHLSAHGRPTAPTVWNDTYNKATNEFAIGDAGPNPLAGGGGKSILFRRPAYQDRVQNVVGGRRGVPDISMSGACNGSVDTYGTFGGAPPGWTPACGTSEATPMFAGIVALADQVARHSLGLINPALYRLSAEHAPGIVDVTSGNNTVSFSQAGREYTVPGFGARPGYDLASGVGTVNAEYFVRELAFLAGH